MSPRVVITGMGAVSPFGVGVELFRRGLLAGTGAFSPFTRFEQAGHRTRLAGEVPLANLASAGGLTLNERFALAAAREALAQAGLRPERGDPELAVMLGTSTGGLFESEAFLDAFVHDGRGRADFHDLAAQQNNGPGDAIARAVGAGGPVETFSSACAAAALAIGAGLDLLRAGEARVVLAGGSDSLCRTTCAGFNALRAVDPEPPRPFRADRQGLAIGEGSAVLVLETLEGARERGAHILAELAGAGATGDAHHMTAPEPSGEGAARAMHEALADAGLTPDDVDFVNAHGTGTPHNDASEAAGLLAVFGERLAALPVTSTKALVGHLLGACGALEAVATILGLTDGVVHAMPAAADQASTLGVRAVLREPLAVPGACVAVSTNFAFGGANAALVFRSPPEGRA